MHSESTFADFLQRLQSGSDEAARVVFERFTHRMVGLARVNLDQRLAAKVDPEDVVQSAYKSFFVRQREGQFEIGGWDGLWSLLTIITVRKCADRAEYFRADKRDIVREAQAGQTDGTSELDYVAFDREPRPDEAAMLTETVEAVFRTINDADERTILEMSLQGYTASEISAALGRSERSVRRLREQTRKRLEQMNA